MLRLDPRTAERIADRHRAAAEDIDALAATAPESVDAGLAQDFVLSLLAGISRTAGELVAYNQVIAAQVRITGDDLADTDAGSSTFFTTIGDVLAGAGR